MTATVVRGFTRAASLADIRANRSHVVHLDGQSIVLFAVGDEVYAVDNRCPHMGYPLSRGSVDDCILTCHWHHARFDLTTGGTFDQWADDVRSFPVEIRGDSLWVDLGPRTDPTGHYRDRLEVGLERNLSLVIAKSSISLLEAGEDPAGPFRIGLAFGTKYRQARWGQGLTMHTCMMNLLPHLDAADRPRAMYHGLTAVAQDTGGMAPRFMVRPLPETGSDSETLKRWLRRFIEVRDAEGAERCVVTAVREGLSPVQIADMLFSAATDHRYIQIGHPLDFINKSFEALDAAGWDQAEATLSSLVAGIASANRMEEANSWRNPIDLVAILERSFERLRAEYRWSDEVAADSVRDGLIPVLHADDPHAIAAALESALRDGISPIAVAGIVAYGAALRIARFHTNNEFGDWDTALHTFTFANAVHQGLRRTPCVELIRGIFDAAMSIYLDRFLNIPPARIPEPSGRRFTADAFEVEFAALLDRQQSVNESAALIVDAVACGRSDAKILGALGKLLLREDRDFHTIQCIEAAIRQHAIHRGTPAATDLLVGAARYLAAHAPTVRAQGQTYQIAGRLQRGDNLYEDAS